MLSGMGCGVYRLWCLGHVSKHTDSQIDMLGLMYKRAQVSKGFNHLNFI